MRRRMLPLRIYMDVGRCEASSEIENAVGHLGANRHVRDVLRLKGYPLLLQVYNGGHDLYPWQETLVDGLRWALS